MKTAHTVITSRFLANLLLNFEDQFLMIKSSYQGEKTACGEPKYLVEFEAKNLPRDDYNGEMSLYIENMYDLMFRRECDV